MILNAALLTPGGNVCCCGLKRKRIHVLFPSSLWPCCQCGSVSLTSRRHSASQHAVKDVGGGVSGCQRVRLCDFVQLQCADINHCILLHHFAQGLPRSHPEKNNNTNVRICCLIWITLCFAPTMPSAVSLCFICLEVYYSHALTSQL